MVQSKSWNPHHPHKTLWSCFCHMMPQCENQYQLRCTIKSHDNNDGKRNTKVDQVCVILTICTSKLICGLNEALVKFRSPFQPWFGISGQHKMHALILHILQIHLLFMDELLLTYWQRTEKQTSFDPFSYASICASYSSLYNLELVVLFYNLTPYQET